MLRNGKKINLELFGLLVLFLSIKYSKTIEPYDQCVAAAYCKMVYGDLLRMANDKSYMKEYENGKHQLKRHFKYVACGVDQIEKNCDVTLKHCILDVHKEAIDILKIPKHLIYGCEIESLPYVLFLCKNIPYWPNTTDIPNDFKTCHHSCSMILQYNQFHLANGKNQNDFPKDWNQNMEQQVQYTRKTKIDPFLKEKSSKDTKSSYEGWLVHSYFEVNRKDQYGKYTNESDQFCKPPSYVAGIIDELPTKFLSNCQLENTNYTFDDNNIYDLGFYPTKNKIIFCDNKYGPPQGSFIVGIRFLIKIITIPNQHTRLRYLTSSSMLCSGHNWSSLRKPIKNIEFPSPDFICPFLSVICSMRFKRFQLENETSYITNIKFGCCTIPEQFLYSGIASTTEEYVDKNKKKNVPQVWISHHFDTKNVTKSYCPRGYFLDKFILERIYTSVKSGSNNNKYIGVIKITFSCNNFDKNDQKPLDETLYKYLYYKGNGSAHENEVHETEKIGPGHGGPPSVYHCWYGFIIGGWIQTKYLGTIDGFRHYEYEYRFICSSSPLDGVGNKWSSKSTTSWVLRNVINQYNPQGRFNFKCPPKYAICGAHSYQNYLNNGDESYLTLHGHIFKFICCPIPIFLSSRDCGGKGIVLNVEKSKQYGDCGEIQGGDTKCEVSYTIGYEEKIFYDRNVKSEYDKPRILKQFGITKQDVLTELINIPNKKIGELAAKLISNLTFTKYLKMTNRFTGPPISTREPLTIFVIIGTLAAGIIPALINATYGLVKDDGEGGESGGGFKGADFRNSITMYTENTTIETFTVYNGQKTFFYDIFLTCGPFKIYSDHNIRYIRPTLECEAICEMEYIGGYIEPNPNGPTIKNFTVQGYGLYIDGPPRHGLVGDLNWVHITSGVKQLFENNPYLILKGNGLNENPFSKTKDSLWERYNPRTTFTASVTFNASHIGYVYRVLASCGMYKVYTDKFLLIIGHKNELDLTKLPRYRNPPFTENPPPKNV